MAPIEGRRSSVRGEAHYRARLTDVQARQLRLSYAAGEASEALSRRYHISAGAVIQVASGKRYRSAGAPITRRKPRKIDDWTALWIRVLALEFSDRDLSDEFGIGADMVKRIRLGINYGWLNTIMPKVTRSRS
jgi:hypothetical protein